MVFYTKDEQIAWQKAELSTLRSELANARAESARLAAQLESANHAAVALGRKGGTAKVRKGAAMATPEEQAARARKGWETRRAKEPAARTPPPKP